MQKLVFINGSGTQIDLTAGNFGITNWAGLSNTGLNIQTQQVPFEDGGVFLDALMEQREIEVTVAIYDGNNLELRYQKKRELISALNPKLGEGTLIYTNDYLSRQIKAVPQIPIFENKNSNDAGTLKASVVFSCPNPYWEDVEANNIILKQNVIQPIINEGDTKTEIEMDIFISNCVNPKIQNLTTGKQIGLNGTFNDNININLNFGKKTVSLSKMTYKYNSIDGVNKIYYSETFKLYIIISNNSKSIFTSKDGVNWSLIGSGGSFNDVFIGDDFIFISNYEYANQNYKTTNGVDWERVTTTVALNKICYSKTLDKYYGTTRAGIYSSSNLLDWTLVYQTDLYNITRSICCSESLIIATESSRGILISSDGENWNEIETDVGAVDVIYVEETKKFYMSGAVQIESSLISITSYSSDGVNWERTIWDSYVQLHSIVFFDGTGTFYINAGSEPNSNCAIYKSKDFVKWDIESSFGNIKNIFGISVANHRVLVSYKAYTDVKLFLYSFNGNSWDNFINTYEIVKFVYSKKLGIYCGYDDVSGWGRTAHIYYSYDGISWYIASNVGSYYGIQDICYSEKIGKFFLTVDGDIYISSDGINWTEQEVDIGEVGLLCSSEKLGIVLCCGSSSYFITTDGESWTRYEGYNFSNICYSEKLGLFCAISYDTSIIRISNDGINWQDINTDYNFSSDSMCVSENLGLFVIATTDLIVSSDGITWIPVLYNIPSSYSSKLITYSEELGLFCFIDDDVNVKISSDGITWIDKVTLTSNAKSVFSITNNGAFRIVTGIGTIVTSIETITNIISDIDKSSDMTLDLIVGENDLLLTQESGSISGRIIYRQKYIGV